VHPRFQFTYAFLFWKTSWNLNCWPCTAVPRSVAGNHRGKIFAQSPARKPVGATGRSSRTFLAGWNAPTTFMLNHPSRTARL
jgi:hypothetical protein